MTIGPQVMEIVDPSTIKEVLLRSVDFRPPYPDEHVPGKSKSFFLSADLFGPERGRFLRGRLLQYLILQRGAILALIDSRVQYLQCDSDLERVELVCRQVMQEVVGVNEQDSLTAIGLCRIASRTPGSDVGNAALQLARDTILRVTANPRNAGGGLLQWLMTQSDITSHERLALTFPFFEMMALGMHRALPEESLRSDIGKGIPEAIAAGTTRLSGLIVTRVATTSLRLVKREINAGDRLLLNITAANERSPTPFLCFGLGEHSCAGMTLVTDLTAAILKKTRDVQ